MDNLSEPSKGCIRRAFYAAAMLEGLSNEEALDLCEKNFLPVDQFVNLPPETIMLLMELCVKASKYLLLVDQMANQKSPQGS
jgi:hypothetical protein